MACTQVESRKTNGNPEVKFTAGLNSSYAINGAEHGHAAAISEPIFALLPVQVYVPRESWKRAQKIAHFIPILYFAKIIFDLKWPHEI